MGLEERSHMPALPALAQLPTLHLPTTPTPRLSRPCGYGEGGATKEYEDATALREKQEEELQAALEEDEEW